MPERDGAAVRVDPRRIEREPPIDGNGLHRKGFVGLDHVDLVERKSGFCRAPNASPGSALRP